jgi:hypothetical protein
LFSGWLLLERKTSTKNWERVTGHLRSHQKGLTLKY